MAQVLKKYPWTDQPTQVDGEFHGLTCKIIMHTISKHYCGYVGVPKDHPMHGKDYYMMDIYVHGGLTFSDEAYWDDANEELWFFGFDCSHSGDICKWMVDSGFDLSREGAVWRDLDFVKAECEKLAKQLSEMKGK